MTNSDTTVDMIWKKQTNKQTNKKHNIQRPIRFYFGCLLTIESLNLSKSQSVKKICSRGAKITAIKDQLIPALQHTAYDSVIIHAGTNDLNESQLEDVRKGLTDMAEEAIKIRPSIKVSVSGLISQREENANQWEDYAYKPHYESCLRLQGLVVYW